MLWSSFVPGGRLLVLGLGFGQSRAGVPALFLTGTLVASLVHQQTETLPTQAGGRGRGTFRSSRFPGHSGLLHHSRCFTATLFCPQPPPPQPQPLFTKATTTTTSTSTSFTSQPAQHNNHRRLLCTLQAQCIHLFPPPPPSAFIYGPPIALAATSCSLRPATRTDACRCHNPPTTAPPDERPPSGTHPRIIILASTQLPSLSLLTDYPSSSLKVKASCTPSQSLISVTLVNLDTESIWSQQNLSWRSSRPR